MVSEWLQIRVWVKHGTKIGISKFSQTPRSDQNFTSTFTFLLEGINTRMYIAPTSAEVFEAATTQTPLSKKRLTVFEANILLQPQLNPRYIFAFVEGFNVPV
jgi:hypothetical protein